VDLGSLVFLILLTLPFVLLLILIKGLGIFFCAYTFPSGGGVGWPIRVLGTIVGGNKVVDFNLV